MFPEPPSDVEELVYSAALVLTIIYGAVSELFF